MLNPNFVILGAAVAALGSLNYLIETLQGKVKPNKVTFFLWALAPLIAFAAQVKQGVGIQSLMTLGVGLSPLTIFIASFFNKKAMWKLKPFDFACGGLSVLGLLLWFVTKEGNLAITFSIAADGLAAIPTIVKSYSYPETENGLLYLTASFSAFVTLLTIKIWSFAYYGFPLYILVVTLIIFVLATLKVQKKLFNAVS